MSIDKNAEESLVEAAKALEEAVEGLRRETLNTEKAADIDMDALGEALADILTMAFAQMEEMTEQKPCDLAKLEERLVKELTECSSLDKITFTDTLSNLERIVAVHNAIHSRG